MANKRQLTVSRELAGTTYKWHLTHDKQNDVITLDDITVEGKSIKFVVQQELIDAAYQEFYSEFVKHVA